MRVLPNYSLRLSAVSVQDVLSVTVQWVVINTQGRMVVGGFDAVSSGALFFATGGQALPEGELISVSVTTDDTNLLLGNARAFIWLEASQNPTQRPRQVVAEGPVSGHRPMSWSQDAIYVYDPLTDAPGYYAPPAPPAGSDISITLNLIEVVELDLVQFVLTTSAAVATRVVQLTLGSLMTVPVILPAPTDQTASQVLRYSFGYSTPFSTPVGATRQAPLPRLGFDGGAVFGTSTQALQAADQFSAVEFGFRWRTGRMFFP